MVRISKTSSNGVRILLDIACHSLDAYVRGQDIAACQGIPYKFVDNILQKIRWPETKQAKEVTLWREDRRKSGWAMSSGLRRKARKSCLAEGRAMS